jgi:hypothetical protein
MIGNKIYLVIEIRHNRRGYPYVEQLRATDNKTEAMQEFELICEDFGATITINHEWNGILHARATGADRTDETFAIELITIYK